MKRYLYIVSLVALLVGCQSESPQSPSLIVEGWIDAGEIPIVLIHRSYVLDTYSPTDSIHTLEEAMESLLIPFGKVTISDGSQEQILTGRIDTAYLPPYTYSSLYMIGKVGSTYTITVNYKEFHTTATTTIPHIATLDSVRVHAVESGAVDIRAYMSGINPYEEAYYALFVREYKSKQFQLCPFGVFESKDALNGMMEIKVYSPFLDPNSMEMINTQFFIDPEEEQQKMYQIKIARIDYRSYLFWKAYNEQIITRGILFVPVYKNLPGNISGGYGIFTGMGSSVYTISLAPDSIYRYK